MNLPNRLTCYRILLSAVFMWLLSIPGAACKSAAIVVFLLATLTDYWDGRLARRTGQVTAFGQLMDPIADKVLTLGAFLSFVQMNLLPAWMALVVVVRDFLLTGLRFAAPATGWQNVRQSGKHKTAFQFVYIIGVLLYLWLRETPGWNLAWNFAGARIIHGGMWAVVALTLWSGVRVLIANREVFR